MSINGLPDKTEKTVNQVEWITRENRSQESGIPDELDVALIVAYDHPFNAEIKVQITNSVGITLFSCRGKRMTLFSSIRRICPEAKDATSPI